MGAELRVLQAAHAGMPRHKNADLKARFHVILVIDLPPIFPCDRCLTKLAGVCVCDPVQISVIKVANCEAVGVFKAPP